MPYLMIKSFNDMLTNDIVSFEQLGPDILVNGVCIYCSKVLVSEQQV